MIAIITGISSGLLVILIIYVLKLSDKKAMYGMVLSGIGFIYVGFSWTDIQALVMNAAQAIFFLFLAYFGIKKNIYFLIAGFFLHGSWDILYHFFPNPELIPPHYDLFCLSIDFTIGFYLLAIKYRNDKKGLEQNKFEVGIREQ